MSSFEHDPPERAHAESAEQLRERGDLGLAGAGGGHGGGGGDELGEQHASILPPATDSRRLPTGRMVPCPMPPSTCRAST